MTRYDEIKGETQIVSIKTIPTNSSSINFYISLTFLLITIVLLITIIICLIKHQAKHKLLLPFHVTNNELKEISYW